MSTHRLRRACRVALALLLAAAILACAPRTGRVARAPQQPRPAVGSVADTVRVLTYNVHIGRGTDGVLDLARSARIIAGSDADLVAVQEVDSATRRTGGLDGPQRLAALTDMEVRFARAMEYDGGAYGVAVLSRLPIASFQTHPLPADSAREPRTVGALRATLPRTGVPLLFLATHLDHGADPATRQAQAEHIVALFGADSSDMTILAGDLNDTPASRTLQTLTRRWRASGDTTATFPAGSPVRKIDYVLYRRSDRVRVLSAEVIDEPVASDHRPLLVVLEVRRLP